MGDTYFWLDVKHEIQSLVPDGVIPRHAPGLLLLPMSPHNHKCASGRQIACLARCNGEKKAMLAMCMLFN